ncbi:cofactor-independent phosphoglycerate mutase [Muricomes sp. OA1]|uniref:Cofactor-independent phosphoglycerate mutase n=1 Tax=Hungatella hathewayi TaxID=154046 RepID=A0A3E2WQS8_9FIRM|nr:MULTISPECIES: cofactor-independent phosphoglycerate mutase [Clostridia]MCH1973574.1 cofactor-independent phosphoglycerate mutase [Muricomes sp. OA1]RGC29674.1 cofactor-independent phosphoglycerate mutase [Hungatella hathewayi]GKH32336.1 homoserine kinase [Faecalicatena contorta]
MKYVIVLCDGAADEPLEELGGRTPLQAAETPNTDKLAPKSEIGMVRTVPAGMAPGSDTANLSVIGYDPKEYYTGRSPLEALSIGVDMEPSDVAFRCNIVTLTEAQDCYEDRVIVDHSSDEISTEDASVLIEALKEGLEREDYEFYVGTSYRHLLIQKEGRVVELTAPHDILTRRIGDYLPADPILREMMEKSYDILSVHPLNVERKRQGKNPANSAWFWGAGTRPMLTSFEEKFGKKGAMISAVDLLKGIATGAGMHNISVDGANGGLHTNYAGKAKAAVKALTQEGYDFAYIHVEAPDEMGHQGSFKNKITAIENIDAHIIGPAAEMLEAAGKEFRMLILPDHPTPVSVRTHTGDPVPYLLYDSRNAVQGLASYDEESARSSGIREEVGHTLISRLFEQK